MWVYRPERQSARNNARRRSESGLKIASTHRVPRVGAESSCFL